LTARFIGIIIPFKSGQQSHDNGTEYHLKYPHHLQWEVSMFGNLLGVVILVAVVVLFTFLVRRAWRSKRAALKWIGVILGGLLTLIVTALTVLAIIGMIKFYVPRGNPAPKITVAGTADQIARGEHIANTLCVGCHSTTGQLPLSGGADIAKDIPIPLGSLVSFNLTPAGPLKDWSDGEIFRALREGVDRNGQPLGLMGGIYVRYMSDNDLQSIIAYLRSQPAVQQTAGGDNINVLGMIMFGAGLIPETPPVTGPIADLPKEATATYGKYIVGYNDCRGCHGDNLTGGTSSLAPKGPNLTAVVPKWTTDQFIQTLRTGVDPTGHQLSPAMPWKDVGKFDDVELGAVYQYIVSISPK
jgi:mono/diheme cytochrome c family protein